jgi:hypothetical protein
MKKILVLMVSLLFLAGLQPVFALPQQAGTPTFGIGITTGANLIKLNGSLPVIGSVNNAAITPFYSTFALPFVEINKDIANNMDVQLGGTCFGGYVEGSSAKSDVWIYPLYLNLRYYWATAGFFETAYVGAGPNLSFWALPSATPGQVPQNASSGYQLLIGGYKNNVWFIENFIAELGYVSLGSPFAGTSAQGFYLKAGIGW